MKFIFTQVKLNDQQKLCFLNHDNDLLEFGDTWRNISILEVSSQTDSLIRKFIGYKRDFPLFLNIEDTIADAIFSQYGMFRKIQKHLRTIGSQNVDMEDDLPIIFNTDMSLLFGFNELGNINVYTTFVCAKEINQYRGDSAYSYFSFNREEIQINHASFEDMHYMNISTAHDENLIDPLKVVAAIDSTFTAFKKLLQSHKIWKSSSFDKRIFLKVNGEMQVFFADEGDIKAIRTENFQNVKAFGLASAFCNAIGTGILHIKNFVETHENLRNKLEQINAFERTISEGFGITKNQNLEFGTQNFGNFAIFNEQNFSLIKSLITNFLISNELSPNTSADDLPVLCFPQIADTLGRLGEIPLSRQILDAISHTGDKKLAKDFKPRNPACYNLHFVTWKGKWLLEDETDRKWIEITPKNALKIISATKNNTGVNVGIIGEWNKMNQTTFPCGVSQNLIVSLLKNDDILNRRESIIETAISAAIKNSQAGFSEFLGQLCGNAVNGGDVKGILICSDEIPDHMQYTPICARVQSTTVTSQSPSAMPLTFRSNLPIIFASNNINKYLKFLNQYETNVFLLADSVQRQSIVSSRDRIERVSHNSFFLKNGQCKTIDRCGNLVVYTAQDKGDIIGTVMDENGKEYLSTHYRGENLSPAIFWHRNPPEYIQKLLNMRKKIGATISAITNEAFKANPSQDISAFMIENNAYIELLELQNYSIGQQLIAFGLTEWQNEFSNAISLDYAFIDSCGGDVAEKQKKLILDNDGVVMEGRGDAWDPSNSLRTIEMTVAKSKDAKILLAQKTWRLGKFTTLLKSKKEFNCELPSLNLSFAHTIEISTPQVVRDEFEKQFVYMHECDQIIKTHKERSVRHDTTVLTASDELVQNVPPGPP